MRGIICIGLIVVLGSAVHWLGRDVGSAEEPPAVRPEDAGKETKEVALNPAERKFKETISNAVLRGRWRLLQDGKLGDEDDDSYTIASAAKIGPGKWVLSARIQYAGKDVPVPVPVDVHWAGDTPVISLTNVGIPGLGTYSARVLFHDGVYTGTWSGPNVLGFLSGVVEKPKPPQPPPKESPEGDVKKTGNAEK